MHVPGAMDLYAMLKKLLCRHVRASMGNWPRDLGQPEFCRDRPNQHLLLKGEGGTAFQGLNCCI